MKKRGKKKKNIANIILIISIIFALIFVIFSFVKNVSEEFKDSLFGLKGELATLSPGAISVSEGLVSYYKFENNVYDFYRRNNGVLYGAVYSDGISGKGLSFDGLDDYVRFNNQLGNFGTSDFSISFWLKTSSRRVEFPISKRGGCKCANFWNVRLESTGNLSFEVSEAACANYVKLTTTRPFNNNQWHHFVVKRENKNIFIYVDGVLEKQQTSAGIANLINSDNFIIGKSGCRSNFKGLIDEVRIYNRALSSEEVAELFLENARINVVRDIELSYSGTSYYTGYDYYDYTGMKYDVELSISVSPIFTLTDNEIIIIAEQIPDRAIIVENSWSVEPTYNFNNTLVWLFANNPPQKLGQKEIIQELPSTISYNIQGSSGDKFKGKWGLKIANLDGLITGENTL